MSFIRIQWRDVGLGAHVGSDWRRPEATTPPATTARATQCSRRPPPVRSLTARAQGRLTGANAEYRIGRWRGCLLQLFIDLLRHGAHLLDSNRSGIKPAALHHRPRIAALTCDNTATGEEALRTDLESSGVGYVSSRWRALRRPAMAARVGSRRGASGTGPPVDSVLPAAAPGSVAAVRRRRSNAPAARRAPQATRARRR